MSGGWLYLWLKALHVVAVISWMAGLLYLPRLFVYHCGAEPGSASQRNAERQGFRIAYTRVKWQLAR